LLSKIDSTTDENTSNAIKNFIAGNDLGSLTRKQLTNLSKEELNLNSLYD